MKKLSAGGVHWLLHKLYKNYGGKLWPKTFTLETKHGTSNTKTNYMAWTGLVNICNAAGHLEGGLMA